MIALALLILALIAFVVVSFFTPFPARLLHIGLALVTAAIIAIRLGLP